MNELTKCCNECNTEINTNSEYCTLCAPHMEGHMTIEDQLDAIAMIMDEKKAFVPRDMVEATCPSCKNTASVIYDGADCKACYVAEKTAVRDCQNQEGDLNISHFRNRETEIRALVGDEEYTDGMWKQFNSRAIGSISFDATRFGIDNNTLLTSAEMEDLSREDAEYEVTPNDLIDHGASFAKSFTIAQVREIMNGEGLLSDSDMERLNAESTKIKSEGAFISAEQKQCNLDFYMGKIAKCKNLRQTAWVGKLMFGAIEGSKRTFIGDEDKEITVPTFLPSGTYKSFWAAFKAKKEELSCQGDVAVQEFQMIIENEADAIRIGKIKQSIYAANLNYNQKKELWSLCEDRRASLNRAA